MIEPLWYNIFLPLVKVFPNVQEIIESNPRLQAFTIMHSLIILLLNRKTQPQVTKNTHAPIASSQRMKKKAEKNLFSLF